MSIEDKEKIFKDHKPCLEEQNLLRKRATAKMVFMKKVSLFGERVRLNDPYDALRVIYGQLDEKFSILEQICFELIDFYSQKNLDHIFIDKVLEYSCVCERIKCDKYLDFLNAKVDTASVNILEENSDKTCMAKLKLEAIKLPHYEGRVRDFPSFIEDFERVVVPVYGKNPAILKQCLGGDALDVIRNRDTDFDEMMRLLKSEYGDARKVVQVVVGDLRRLYKVKDDDIDGFIQVIKTVHSCYTDLVKVNMETEINNVSIVNDLEDILPTEPKQRWFRLSRDIENKEDLFPKLLAFLLEEKKDLEKMYFAAKRSDRCVKFNTFNESDSNLEVIAKQLNSTASVLEKVCSRLSELENGSVSHEDGMPTGYKQVRGGFKDDHNTNWCFCHNFLGHSTISCGKFRSLTAHERLDVLKKRRCCFICCQSVGHGSSACPTKKRCSVKTESKVCNMPHHPLLHDAFVSSRGMDSNIFSSASRVLLETTLAYSGNIPVSILWDSGAQGSLITHRKARELGAVGVPVSGPIGGVGDFRKWVNTKQYLVKLQDRWGTTHEILCVGMNEVAGKVAEFDVMKVSHLFPEFNFTEMIRPTGYCDMLIGNDYCWLQPRPIADVGKLQLMESVFGFSVRGHPPDNIAAGGGGQIPFYNNLSFDLQKDYLKDSLDNLFHIESAGIQAPIREENAMEKYELELIERGLRYDDGNKVWIASYPWIQDPDILPNNYKAVLGRLRSVEKGLLSDKYKAEAYLSEMKDMLARGVARLLSPSEVHDHIGPVHYIAHFGVIKPDSTTTPLRIVFDPSTQFMGHKLNEFWAKGPNVVANLFIVLLRFRRELVGMAGDISKMYHSVKLETKEQHVHRFLWRNLEVDQEPQIYVLTTVTFGDRPSGVLATIAMRYTAMMQQELYPDVVEVVQKDTYVDDILPNSDTRKNAEKLASRINTVLSEGSFHVKGWVMTGDESASTVNIDMSKELGQKVLGMLWDPKSDEFKFKVKLNFSPKFRGIRSGNDMTQEECVKNFPAILTRRMIVSQIAAIFDPYGFLIPFTVKSKFLLRKLIMKNSDVKENCSVAWDEHLDEAIISEWKDFFTDLFEVQHISFPRSVKFDDVINEPILIVFSDASQSAYGCCAYVRWQCIDGQYRARLIAAKSRIAPKRQLSIPRLELAGAVLAVRLRQTITQEMGIKFREVIHVVDSTIVRSQIQKESQSFKMFVAVRVSEIQEKSDPVEWWWTESKYNVADMVTKPCNPKELGQGSIWQDGPAFLKMDREQWPMSQSVIDELPEFIPDLKVNVCSTEVSDSIWSNIDATRFKSFSKVVRVIARILKALQKKSFKALWLTVGVDEIICAEKYLFRGAQEDLGDWSVKYRRLGPFKENNVVYVGGRIKRWLKDNWNADAYVLLPPKHPISTLIISELHNETHEGVETTLCKLLAKYWIPTARKMIKAVKRACITCRIIDKEVAGQCMGQVSDIHLKPTPVFYHCATDIFGPFVIKDSVKRRTHGKCYGIIFTCLTTRAIHIEIAEDYSTKAFLGAFSRFSSVRGFPSTMHSDNGKQLQAANKELIKISDCIDSKVVGEFAARHRMDWSFNRSSDAPWLNASCESLIRSVKVSLQKAINDSILTFPELQTVMYEVATLVNSRPIGVKPGNDIDLGSYLSPNDLLLGRNNRLAPVGMFNEDPDPRYRFQFMQCLANNFWKRWQRDYFPLLIIRNKWHTRKRNVQVGDIVLVQDANAVRGDWRLGEVAQVHSGRDGMVRDVTVRYKIATEGSIYKESKNRYIKRSVHRLVVVLPVNEK